MNALEYNMRIRIEKSGSRDPDYNTPTASWEFFAEVWAKVEDTKPSKTDATQQGLRLARDAATVWIRRLNGVTSDMRIVELSDRRRTLSITGGPAMINGGTYLEFTVEKFSV